MGDCLSRCILTKALPKAHSKTISRQILEDNSIIKKKIFLSPRRNHGKLIIPQLNGLKKHIPSALDVQYYIMSQFKIYFLDLTFEFLRVRLSTHSVNCWVNICDLVVGLQSCLFAADLRWRKVFEISWLHCCNYRKHNGRVVLDFCDKKHCADCNHNCLFFFVLFWRISF